MVQRNTGYRSNQQPPGQPQYRQPQQWQNPPAPRGPAQGWSGPPRQGQGSQRQPSAETYFWFDETVRQYRVLPAGSPPVQIFVKRNGGFEPLGKGVPKALGNQSWPRSAPGPANRVPLGNSNRFPPRQVPQQGNRPVFGRNAPQQASQGCFTCGQPGHYSRSCPQNKAGVYMTEDMGYDEFGECADGEEYYDQQWPDQQCEFSPENYQNAEKFRHIEQRFEGLEKKNMT